MVYLLNLANHSATVSSKRGSEREAVRYVLTTGAVAQPFGLSGITFSHYLLNTVSTTLHWVSNGHYAVRRRRWVFFVIPGMGSAGQLTAQLPGGGGGVGRVWAKVKTGTVYQQCKKHVHAAAPSHSSLSSFYGRPFIENSNHSWIKTSGEVEKM